MSGPRAAGFEFFFIGSKLHGGIKAREAIAKLRSLASG